MLKVYIINLFWATPKYFPHEKVFLYIFNKDTMKL